MRRELPTEGRFTCLRCGQKYDVPGTTVKKIRDHLRNTHDMKKDSRWVRCRLKPIPKESNG